MGLLDELMGEVASQASPGAAAPGGEHAAMTEALLGMLGQQGGSGLAGMASSFQQGGLGHLVESWISTGPNQPATAAQVEQGLGGPALAQLAQRAGVSPQVASALLATVLPVVVNKLTPQGQVPTQDALGSLLGAALGGGSGGGGGLVGGLLGGLLGGKQ
jgi:uncharacterized protein YidB (DUF937 family)